MPRRSILSASERDSLLALPDSRDDLIRRYTFSESDLSIVRQRRGTANRLGFAVQLCYLRYPGIVLGVDQLPLPALLHLVAGQLRIPVERWAEYGERAQTRREHLVELQAVFGFEPFTRGHHRLAVEELMETAMQTDKGIVLATALVEMLRERAILQPRLDVIEDVCAEAITRANRRIYKQLNHGLTEVHRERLDRLFVRRAEGILTQLAWLRQAPLKPNSKHMLEHIDRLRAWRALDLPAGIERQVHQNRLLKIAREGGQMTSADLMRFERQRRYATLVALAVEGTATITDEVIGLHDRIVGKLFMPRSISTRNSSRQTAKRSTRSSGFMEELGKRCWRPGRMAVIPSPQSRPSSPGKTSRQALRSAETCAARGLRLPAPDRRRVRDAAPVRAGASGRTRIACGSSCKTGSRGHRTAARGERRRHPRAARRCSTRLHPRTLGQAHLYRCRHRSPLLRAMRLIGAQERASLGRHMGRGLAAVQELLTNT